jgi:hypothetical protein
MRLKKIDITVVSDGSEDRFLQRSHESFVWQEFDFYNCRHKFSPPQSLSATDVLRRAFRVSGEVSSDNDLVTTPPSNLRILALSSAAL